MRHRDSRQLLSAAIAGLIATTPTVSAADDKPAAETERCYGIAQAGKNDCATARHTCANSAKASNSPDDYVLVAKGTCEKLGGKLVPEQPPL